jgi:PAS domain S-box-containing protein
MTTTGCSAGTKRILVIEDDRPLRLTISKLLQKHDFGVLEAEDRYRAIFEQGPDGIVILDPATARPLEFNTAAHRQLGYSREEFARLSLADIEAEETPEQTRATIESVQRTGSPDFETRHRTRDGQFRHVHVRAQPVEASGRPVYHCVWRDITARKQAQERVQRTLTQTAATPGATSRVELRYRHKNGSWRALEVTARNLLDDANVKGIIVNSRDTTERRELEEALRESSQFNQQIIASAREGIIVYAPDLRYRVWNRFMEQLTGLPAEAVVGKHPRELFPFLEETGVVAEMQASLAGGASSGTGASP